MIQDTDIIKFTDLFAAKFGVEINKDDAYIKLSALVTQMGAVYKPIRNADAEKYEDENVESNEIQNTF